MLESLASHDMYSFVLDWQVGWVLGSGVHREESVTSHEWATIEEQLSRPLQMAVKVSHWSERCQSVPRRYLHL
jgi:hypothetical protein